MNRHRGTQLLPHLFRARFLQRRSFDCSNIEAKFVTLRLPALSFSTTVIFCDASVSPFTTHPKKFFMFNETMLNLSSNICV